MWAAAALLCSARSLDACLDCPPPTSVALVLWTGSPGHHGPAPIELSQSKQIRLLREAEELFKKWQYRSAEQRSLELLEMAQHSQDTYYQALALLIAGESQEKLGEIRTSLRSFEHMLALPQDPRCEKMVQGWAYNGIGNAYIRLGEYAKAIENLKKYLESAQQLGDTPGQGIAYANIANAHNGLGQYKAAIDYANKHLDIAQQLGDKPGQGRAYAKLGNAHQGLGQYKAAIEYHKKYLDIVQQLDNKPGQGIAYGNLGNAHHGLGQYQTAIDYANKDLGIKQELDDKPGQGAAYGNLGNAHQGLGQYDTAIEYHQKHLDIAQQLDDKPGQGIVCGNLGIAYRSMGQYDTAIECHQKSLEISIELDDKPGQGAAYASLGTAHDGLGQRQAAIEYHQKHLDIALQLGDKPGQGRAYANLGSAYGELEEYALAIEYSQKYLDITHELGDLPGQRLAHGNLGLFYAKSGQFGLACPHFASSDALVRRMEAQLTEGQWRRHLLTSGGPYAALLDWWVVAAARSGDMAEALWVEERRRCRSEVAYQADVRGRQGGVDGLKAMTTRTGASFVVVTKMHQGTLLTWVLSGETGELVYGKAADIAGREDEIEECVNRVTFAEWAEWQEVLCKARKLNAGKRSQKKDKQIWDTIQTWLKRWVGRWTHTASKGKQAGAIMYSWVKDLIENLIPAEMKGDMENNLWTSIRDPGAFPATVCGRGKAAEDLRAHFFKKAEVALQKLSELLWEPILAECQALSDYLNGDAPRTKLVGSYFRPLGHLYFAERLVTLARMSCAPLQIYFLPDPALSSIPFCALKVGDRFLIEKALVAQASSLCTLDYARVRWDTICNEPQPSSEVGLECRFE